jgi:NAD(P)-dependent dehydrogenase (short-subunit alcohol dehydrogenase family)
MADRHDVRGRSVLITGAARGIGAESARQLSARGARVSLVGLEPERLEALAGELGSDAAWFEADVRDRDALERAVAGTVERFGGIDVVIANAGIRNPMATVATVDPDAFERVIEVNLIGMFRTVRAVLPQLLESRGYLLCVASLAAAAHAPLMAPYAAAKAGVEAFANSLRLEVADKGVDVGVVYFSFIETDMVREGREVAEAQTGGDSPRAIAKPIPVAKAVKGIVRGIERRSQRVVVPRLAYPIILAGELLRPVVDIATRRQMADVVRGAERRPERDPEAKPSVEA